MYAHRCRSATPCTHAGALGKSSGHVLGGEHHRAGPVRPGAHVTELDRPRQVRRAHYRLDVELHLEVRVRVVERVLPVAHRDVRRVLLGRSGLRHVLRGLEREAGHRPAEGGPVPERVERGDYGAGGVGLGVLLPADGEHPVEHPARHVVVGPHGNGRAGGPAGGHLHYRLAEGAAAVDRPGVHVVDALEVVHVADDYRVDVPAVNLRVVQRRAHRLVYELDAGDVAPGRALHCHADADYPHSLACHQASPPRTHTH